MFASEMYRYPVCMLVVSPEAEKLFANRECSCADALAAQAAVRGFDLPVRTTGEQAYRITDFTVRMVNASDLHPLTQEEVDKRSYAVLSGALGGGQQEVNLVEKAARGDDEPAFWFLTYWRELVRSLSFGDHESFDNPVAVMFAVSTSEADPWKWIQQNFSWGALPEHLRPPVPEEHAISGCVLLDDPSRGISASVVETQKREMGSHFRELFAFVSLEPMSDQREDPPDGKLADGTSLSSGSPSPPSTTLHSRLTEADKSQLGRVTKDLIVKGIIPFMEKRIRYVSHHVASARKGLMNQFKMRLFKRKDAIEDKSASGALNGNSPETQLRLLADYAFMLKDYELAVSTYRLLVSDLKNDKAWMPLAAAYEGLGMALILHEGAKRDAEVALLDSIEAYRRAGNPAGVAYATRAALVLVEAYRGRQLYREAARELMRAAERENHSRAGLLLEQAAFNCLLLNPPLTRRAAFHMVLAGFRFSQSSQREHALRAYKSIQAIYVGKGWSFIDDHLMSAVGRQSAHLGQFVEATKSFSHLVSSPHQPVKLQQNFLNEFLYVLEQAGPDVYDHIGGSLELDLPIVSLQGLAVAFEDSRCLGSPHAMNVGASIWETLEEVLIPSDTGGSLTWLDANYNAAATAEACNDCVAGEDLRVSVELSNPLGIPVDVSHIRLRCDFKPAEGALERCKQEMTENPLMYGMILDGVEYFEESLILQPEERVTLRLAVKPRCQGLLRIVGLDWTLQGIAKSHKQFPATQLGARKGKRNRRPVGFDPSKCLLFRVSKPMPYLQSSVHPLPMRFTKGQVHRARCALKNAGNAPLNNIKFCCGTPEIICLGEPFTGIEAFSSETAPIDEYGAGNAVVLEQSELFGGKGKPVVSVTSVPLSSPLFPGDSVEMPLWIYADRSEKVDLEFVFYVEPADEDLKKDMPFRILRMAYTVPVSPSMTVRAIQLHSPSDLQKSIVHVRAFLENGGLEDVQLTQVSCVGSSFTLRRLGGAEGGQESDPFLLSGQDCVLESFLELRETQDCALGKSEKQSGGVSSNRIGLGPLFGGEDVVNINCETGVLREFIDRQLDLCRRSRSPADAARTDGQLHEESLVLIWQSPSIKDGVGMHIVKCLSGKGNETPLRWTLEGPKNVRHRFGCGQSSPICSVPLYCHILNTSSSEELVVRVDTWDTFSDGAARALGSEYTGWQRKPDQGEEGAETPRLTSPRSGEQASRRCGTLPCGEYVWCSTTKKSLVLRAQESVRIPMKVAVFMGGMYVLDRCKVSWSVKDGNNSPQLTNLSGVCGVARNAFVLTVTDEGSEAGS
mmetsp:Transcript_3681/g.13240  ORF Transcript_3681/g.13240 Transcript_3681/m.13240 type:complete len:1302 (-) Transcript_3681:1632-5537(-)